MGDGAVMCQQGGPLSLPPMQHDKNCKMKSWQTRIKPDLQRVVFNAVCSRVDDCKPRIMTIRALLNYYSLVQRKGSYI